MLLYSSKLHSQSPPLLYVTDTVTTMLLEYESTTLLHHHLKTSPEAWHHRQLQLKCSDWTIFRVAHGICLHHCSCYRFLAVCPSAQATHITAWLKRNIPSSVIVTDKTSQFCVLGLMGPKSREVLQPLTSTSLENFSFPFGTSQVHQGLWLNICICNAELLRQ